MGLFGNKDKQKVLALPEKMKNDFIQPLSNKLIEIKLGDKIKVNKDNWAVFVLKDKPQDVFNEGEWEISLPNIPQITKLLKLDKSRVVKKDSKQELVFQNNFKCDIYFVSKKEFTNQEWQTRLIYKKPKTEKRFTVLVRGTCGYKSVEPKATIRLFLLEWAKFDANKTQIRMKKYINEFATEAIEWYPCSSHKDLIDYKQVGDAILQKLQKNFNKYGLEIINFRVDKIEFGKELQEQVDREKEQNDFASDLINEISAEISVEDKNVEELVTTRSKEAEVTKKVDKADVLDMTAEEVLEDKNPTTEQKAENEIITDLKKVKIDKNKTSKEKTEDLNEETTQKIEDKTEKVLENEDNTQAENVKICPKCRKKHELDVSVCDCGCNLE